MIRLAAGEYGIKRREQHRAGERSREQIVVNFARHAQASNPDFEIRYYRDQFLSCQVANWAF
jgi:hypothetical protein